MDDIPMRLNLYRADHYREIYHTIYPTFTTQTRRFSTKLGNLRKDFRKNVQFKKQRENICIIKRKYIKSEKYLLKHLGDFLPSKISEHPVAYNIKLNPLWNFQANEATFYSDSRL